MLRIRTVGGGAAAVDGAVLCGGSSSVNGTSGVTGSGGDAGVGMSTVATAASGASGGRQTAPLEVSERAAVLGRLQLLSFVATELRVLIPRSSLEAAWGAMRSAEARETLLIWLPSALPALSPDALAYGYLELLLRELRWDTLTPHTP